MDSLYIVMPAYNEEDNIERVVKDWYHILNGKGENSRLIVADNGSTDRTHEILLNLKRELPQLELLEKSEKQHGPKLIALYKYAILKKTDYVFQTDSDGQTDPNEFEKFWDIRNKYDAIIGNRCVRGDGIVRAFVEHIVCFLIWGYFGIRVPDANAPFRLIKTTILGKYINRFQDDYNLPNVMLTAFFSYYREKITFIEISFKSRQAGTNSINLPKIIKIGWNSLRDFREFKRQMKEKDRNI